MEAAQTRLVQFLSCRSKLPRQQRWEERLEKEGWGSGVGLAGARRGQPLIAFMPTCHHNAVGRLGEALQGYLWRRRVGGRREEAAALAAANAQQKKRRGGEVEQEGGSGRGETPQRLINKSLISRAFSPPSFPHPAQAHTHT